MSCLDSTIETEKDKKSNNKELEKSNFIKTIMLYNNEIRLSESSQIFNYNPNDMNYFYDIYKMDKTVIYSESLSASIIYSGIDKLTNEKVVIKYLKKEKLREYYMHEMAKNELAIHYSLSKLTKNIVKVYDYFEDENGYYLIMELAEDPTYFEDLLENRYCPVSDEKTLKGFAFDILTGLKEIHNNNIIHCDIKPQNFLLLNNDNFNFTEYNSYYEDYILKITDFGLAHILPEGSDKTSMQVPCGTFAYSAPEVTYNCLIDKSIDIWSFGISLYQMAVAYLPTALKQYKYGTGPIPFRNCDWIGYDHNNLQDLITKCLQFDPCDRISVQDALDHPWFDE